MTPEITTPARKPSVGDVIQIGYKILGDPEIQWGTYQIVSCISSDGTLWYRPREAKVDKSPGYWRFPVEPEEEVIKDLRRYANPKAVRELLKRR